MIFKPASTIKVGIDFGSGPLDVGRLAIRDRIIYFEYARNFIERGLEISPLGSFAVSLSAQPPVSTVHSVKTTQAFIVMCARIGAARPPVSTRSAPNSSPPTNTDKRPGR